MFNYKEIVQRRESNPYCVLVIKEDRRRIPGDYGRRGPILVLGAF